MRTTPRPEKEQVLLGRLAVFEGSWTSEAAEAICAGDGADAVEIRALLTGLADKSLLTAVGQGRETRYRFRDATGHKTGNRLGEAATLRQRHRDWYLGLAEQSEPKLWGAEQAAWKARLAAERDNLRAALTWSLAQPDGAEGALRLATALRGFWFMRGELGEGRKWIEKALERGTGVPPSVLSKGLQTAAFFALEQGDLDRAEDFGERGVALARTLDDSENHIRLLVWLGKSLRERGDYARAEGLFTEGIALARRADRRRQIWTTSAELARVWFRQEHYERAAALYSEVLAWARSDGDQWYITYALRGLASCALQTGNHDRASEHYTESLQMARSQQDPLAAAWSLEGLADVAAAGSDWKEAVMLYGAVESLRTSGGKARPAGNRADFEQRIAAMRERLGEAAFTAAWAEGGAMTLEQAIEYALATESM